MNRKSLSDHDLQYYLAGFLDGDGSVNCQIIHRRDYIHKFQILFTITFFQKVSHHWFMIWLSKKLKVGLIRKRNDGISEYTITGSYHVRRILLWLLPAIQLKKKQANLVLLIISRQSKNQSREEFISLCEMVDQIANMNYSKLRVNTSAVVKKVLGEDSLESSFPVETSEE